LAADTKTKLDESLTEIKNNLIKETEDLTKLINEAKIAIDNNYIEIQNGNSKHYFTLIDLKNQLYAAEVNLSTANQQLKALVIKHDKDVAETLEAIADQIDDSTTKVLKAIKATNKHIEKNYQQLLAYLDAADRKYTNRLAWIRDFLNRAETEFKAFVGNAKTYVNTKFSDLYQYLNTAKAQFVAYGNQARIYFNNKFGGIETLLAGYRTEFIDYSNNKFNGISSQMAQYKNQFLQYNNGKFNDLNSLLTGYYSEFEQYSIEANQYIDGKFLTAYTALGQIGDGLVNVSGAVTGNNAMLTDAMPLITGNNQMLSNAMPLITGNNQMLQDVVTRLNTLDAKIYVLCMALTDTASKCDALVPTP